MRLAPVTLALPAILFALAGCSNAVDDIDKIVDCANICDRYQECVDSEYDTDACRDRCENIVESEDPRAANECDTCLDDRSCSEAVFPCADDCTEILLGD